MLLEVDDYDRLYSGVQCKMRIEFTICQNNDTVTNSEKSAIGEVVNAADKSCC